MRSPVVFEISQQKPEQPGVWKMGAIQGFRFGRDSPDDTVTGLRRLKSECARSRLRRLVQEQEADAPKGLEELLNWHDFRSQSGMSLSDFMHALPGSSEVLPLNRMKMVAELWDYFEPRGVEAGRVA